MNKKSMLKLGVVSILVFILVSILFIIILQKNINASIVEKKVYVLGEKIKFNMENLGNYDLKIITPSTIYRRNGENDVFVFNPNEVGKYAVQINRGGKIVDFSFEVVKNPFQEGDDDVFEEEDDEEENQSLIQETAVINKPVKWKKKVNNTYIEYFTEPPKVVEKSISHLKKKVFVSSSVHYQDVLAYTSVQEVLRVEEKENIRVRWIEENAYMNYKALDTNNNGFIDRVEWVIPHLSNQTFEIILIIKASHLNETRNYVEDIYSQVKDRDFVYKTIPENHYVRVVFEKNLTKDNDITIYAKSNFSGKVEVYEKNSSIKIADFGVISEDKKYKIYLMNLTSESQDSFDLRIVNGSVDFDYIVDPSESFYYTGWESGADGWVDGGSDSDRSSTRSRCTDSGTSGGTYSWHLRDDSSTSYTQRNFNFSKYSTVNVTFSAYYTSIESGECLDFKCDGTILWSYCANEQGTEDQWLDGFADDQGIIITPDNCTFDDSVTLRFEAEFSGNWDHVYIDCFNLTGVYPNTAPTHSTPILKSSELLNSTSEDLICYNQSTSDADGDDVKNIYNWYLNGSSFEVLNVPFEAGSNNTFTKDYSGRSSNGSVHGAVWNYSGGYDGFGAYEFDGINDNITFGTGPSLNGKVNFTLMAWIKTSSASDQVIIQQRDTGYNGEYWFRVSSSGVLNFVVYGNSAYQFNFNSVSTVNDGNWHFVVAERQGNNGYLYIDGSLDASSSGTARDLDSSIGVGIGYDIRDHNRPFNGFIDDVRIYNRSLSSNQILALYQNKTNRIKSDETSVGENWSCSVTPVDVSSEGSKEGSTLRSSNLIILSNPAKVGLELLYPPGNLNVAPNTWFNVSVNVSCINSDCGGINVTLDPVNWWSSNWHYRKEINITSAVSSDLTNFPIYLNITKESAMQSDYDDLRFINGSCDEDSDLELSYEIEFSDSDNADIWLKMPLLKSGINTICLYYGNDAASNNENISDVWSNGYVGVWHLSETSGTLISDSTSNDLNGTANSLVTLNQAGIVGRSVDIDPSTGSIDSSVNLPSTYSSWTLEGWLQLDSTPGWGDMWADSAGSERFPGQIWDSGTFGCYDSSQLQTTSTFPEDGTTWVYLTSKTDGSNVYVYWNGVQENSNSDPNTLSGTWSIGDRTASGEEIDGRADEIRVSSVSRSNDWINESYQIVKNQNNYVSSGAGEYIYSKGIMPVNSGSPFYTNISSNPYNISLNKDESQIVTFWVYVNSSDEDTYEFFVYANRTSSMIISNITEKWNVSIVAEPPNVIISSPVNQSTFADVTPLLNVSLSVTANTLWYTLNGGSKHIICSHCSGEQTTFMHLEEENYVLRVYTNNSANQMKSNFSDFTVDMDYNYYDNYNDNSSLLTDQMNDVSWQKGNVSFSSERIQIAFIGCEDDTVEEGKWKDDNSGVAGTLDCLTAAEFGDASPRTGSYAFGMSGNFDPNVDEWNRTVDLSGYRNVNISLWTSTEDTESADNFTLFYWNGTDWAFLAEDLNRASSAQTSWVEHIISIPNSAATSSFELRITWETSSTGEHMLLDDINITGIPISGGNFTAYSINTSSTVVEFTNITWSETNVDGQNNNISVQISADAGQNWYDAINGHGISSIATGNSIIYRALFVASEGDTIYLNDMNISWTDHTTPPPNITINSPVNLSVLDDVTPLLNVSLSGTANTLWYTTDNGVTNHVICSSCSGEQTAFMYLEEGDYTLNVYTNNSVNDIATNSSEFSVDLNFSFYDDYNDNSSISKFDGASWNYGNVSFNKSGGGVGNFTSYTINTTYTIVEILNVTWDEVGTYTNNNISVQISANDGLNWYTINKSNGLQDFAVGKHLIYRVLFSTDGSNKIYINNINITWTNETSPPPTITINSPINQSTLADVTPILNVTLSGKTSKLWYNVDNGENYTICTDCSGEQTTFLHVAEGNFVVHVYTSNPLDVENTNSSNFTVDMNYNYYDDFNDNSSLLIEQMNNVVWNKGNVSFVRSGGAASIKNVQKGSAEISGTTVDITIDSVNVSSSILFYSTTIDNNRPDNSLVRGHLSASNNIHFERAASTGTVYISWYVAEFDSGVSVQSGTYTHSGSSTVNVPLSTPVNVSAAFPIVGFENGASGIWGTDDDMRYRLTSSTNLETYVVSTPSDTLAYQVVDYGGSIVQNGTFTLSGSSSDVDISEVDLNKSIVYASWAISGNVGADDDGLIINFTNSTRIHFERTTTTNSLYLAWYVVEFTGSENVQTGNEHFDSTTTQKDITLSAIDTGKSVAIISGKFKGGKGTDTDDNMGTVWFLTNITNSTNLHLERATTDTSDTADVQWFVIQFAGTETNGNFTAYAINTTQVITFIENVTWTESGTDSSNTIQVQISADGGLNWYNATNGQGISSITSGYSLVYRVLYDTTSPNIVLSLKDMNISWSSSVESPPNITIISPVNDSIVDDITPLLNISLDGNATELWYNIDGGENVTICTHCSGIQSTFLYLEENDYTVNVFASNPLGSETTNQTSFTVYLNKSFYDDYNDNSSISSFDGTNWNVGNVSFSGEISKADIKSVQRGCGALSAANDDITINSVNVSSSILFLTNTIDNAGPSQFLLTGYLSSSTNIHIQRQTSTGTVYYCWYVAEFEGGVNVQSGTISQGSTTNTAISSVNVSQTFPLISYDNNGAQWGSDDCVRARLTSDTNLETYAVSSLSSTLAYQVVQYDGANIQNGTFTLSSGSTSSDVSINPVDLNKSFVIMTYASSGDLGADDGGVLVNFTSSNQIHFERVGSSSNLYVSWYVVEFSGSENVQTGNANFDASTTSVNIPINSVNLDKSVAFLSFSQKGGMGSDTNDNPGTVWFTANLTNSTNLKLERATTDGGNTASVQWFVVEFSDAEDIGSFTSYTINVTQPIKQILNISWTEDNTDSNNTISVNISVDNGQTWYNTSNGNGLSVLNSDRHLIYKVFFTARESGTFSISDMNISWSEPPTVNIVYPENISYSSHVVELNYTVSAGQGLSLDSCWWTNDSGVTNYSITCGQNISGISSVEGSNTWIVYSNDSDGAIGSDSVTFIVDMTAPSLTFINQTDEDSLIVNESHALEEGQNLTINMNVTDSNLDKVWVVVWETIKNGAKKFETYLSYVGGALWQAIIPTDYDWKTYYNYTVYANDTSGYESEYDGNFTILKLNSTLSLTPNPSDGTGNVTVSGHLNFTNSSVLGNWPINIWLDGSLLLFSNLTPVGNYENYRNFTDTDGEDFNKGTYYHTTTDGENLTLTSGNTTGNFTKILDAGARVEWTNISWEYLGSACSALLTYQNGDSNNYLSTADTYLDSGNANTNYADNVNLLLDTSPDTYRTLINFENVVGYGGNKIPYNATIYGSNITVYVYDAGDEVDVYEILENWTETRATYNSRLLGVSWGASGCSAYPSRSNTLESSFTPSSIGYYTFDITNAMKRWVNQTSEDYGVVLHPTSSASVGIRSSDNETLSVRPKLTVDFSSSDCTSVLVYVRTSNDKISWTDWQQVSNNENINDPNNASRYLQYKVELSSINSSSTPYLNNIVVNYTAIVTNSSGDYAYNFSSPSDFGSYSVVMNTSYRTIFTQASGTLSVQVGISPEIELISPATELWFSYGNLTLIYNASDGNDDIVNTTLIINGLMNQTNQTAVNNGLYSNFTINFTSGVYNWTVNVTDVTNNVATDNERTFYIDLEDPNITLIYPFNDSPHTVNELNLSFNVSDNMDDVLSCDVVMDGSTIHSGIPANNSEITNVSSGILTNGLHYWNVSCSDEAGRIGISDTWIINISDTPPIVNLTSPNKSYVDADGNISFIYYPDDNTGFLNCSLIINDSFYKVNQSEVLNQEDNQINATNLAEGNYNWTIECFDLSSSSYKADARNFSVDLYPPNVSLNAPLYDSLLSSSVVNLNFTVNDSFDSILECNISINGEIIDSFSANSGELTNREIENLTDGLKFWNVTCIDDAGHLNTSETWNFTVAEAPRVYLNTSNNSFYTGNSITLSYTPFDNSNLSKCDLYLNGLFNQTNSTNILNAEQNDFDLNNLDDGVYQWYVNCSDYVGLSNVSEIRIFYIDNQAPEIILYYPNDSEVHSVNITFNFSVSDNLDTNLTCNLSIDDVVKDYNFDAINGSVTNRTISDITDGYHTWYLNCSDDAGNLNGSLIYNFTRMTNPGLTLILPEDGYWFNTSVFNLTYFPEDDEGIANASLIINGEVNRTNSTAVINNADNNFSIDDFADGVYNWTVNVSDITGLIGTDSERTFYIDTHVPIIIINQPNGSEIVTTNNVSFNFTAIDNLDNYLDCNLTLDGDVEYSGESQNGSEEIVYILVVDGNHTWNVSCWDNASNLNFSETINFTIKAPPNVTLDDPPDLNRTKDQNVTFTYTPIDPIGIRNCSLYLDGVLNDSDLNPVPNQQNNFTVIDIIEGAHNWTVECTDNDNNQFEPENRTIYVDRSPPYFELENPANNSLLDANEGSVVFSWKAIDLLDSALQCNLTVDGVIQPPGNEWTGSNVTMSKTVSGLSTGTHYWNVTCWDRLDNLNISETRIFNISYPDFSVNSTDIVFNNSEPKENEVFRINATIWNHGGADTTGVLVGFYIGDPDDSGYQIGDNISLDINAYSNVVVNTTWNSSMGTNEIYVVVDPPFSTNGSFDEVNETNNKASKNVTTGSWQFFYGEISPSSVFRLANSNGKNLSVWFADDSSNGNLFIADSESIISWSNLQAIGKNISGGNTTNDFSDIDVLLSMGNYDDSVYNLYTNSGIIKNKTSFIIFNHKIENVPIVDSINNSNFVTGILWDMNDDSDNEFSQNDKEDLVFISGINKSKQGAYGVYDYEIRVPAKLREYNPADSSSVVFYAELY